MIALLGSYGQLLTLQEGIVGAAVTCGKTVEFLNHRIWIVQAVFILELMHQELLHGRGHLVGAGIAVLTGAIEHMLVVAGALLGSLKFATENSGVLKIRYATLTFLIAVGTGVRWIAVGRQCGVGLDSWEAIGHLAHAAIYVLVSP